MREIDYTRKMKFQWKPLPSFNWSDKTWATMNETGLVHFEAETVSFQIEIEALSPKENLEYDLIPAWSRKKGSFLSIADWQGNVDGKEARELLDLSIPSVSCIEVIRTEDLRYGFANMEILCIALAMRLASLKTNGRGRNQEGCI
jgi:hypothetical protein